MPAKTLRALVGGCAATLALCACTPLASNLDLEDTTESANLPREIDGQTAELFSAFFGLDDSLPFVANRICLGGWGKDGMPVIFSTEIDHTTMQAGDFTVIKQSGAKGTVHCVSLLPATDAGELRTALLIGEFGDASEDPPARVEITGHLFSIDRSLDFKGAGIGVIPLEDGPALAMAELVNPEAEDAGLGLGETKGSLCPIEGVEQAVRAVWQGGVTLESGEPAGAAERELYRVRVRAEDGEERELAPIALADNTDPDNNHILCLDTPDEVVSVSFPGEVFTDPNNDLNPPTSVMLSE